MADDESTLTEMMVELKYLRQDVAELKEDVKSLHDRPCPSIMCYEHEQRIGTLETYFKILVGVFVVVIIPLALTVVGSLLSK